MSESVLPTLVAMRQRRGVIHHVPHNQNRYFKFPQQCYMLTIKKQTQQRKRMNHVFYNLCLRDET